MSEQRGPSDAAGAPGDHTTLTAVLAAFARDGYDGNVTITEDGLLRCAVCRRENAPDEVVLDSLRRLEGASDPADMMAVLAVQCPSCGDRGVAVANYGPEASPAEATVLLALDDRRRDTDDPET